MAQGSAIKKAASSATGAGGGGGNKPGRKNQPKDPKKGARVIKPKTAKGGKAAADKMRKKLNAGLTTKTEKVLGERAGHLELIGPGRDRSANAKKNTDGKKAGGSKKFG